MKSSKIFTCLAVLFLSISAGALYCQDLAIDIDISPSTLNLAYQGQLVTVHTNIPYSAVVGASVKLDGVDIEWWKSDDRGYFVAKFNVDDVKNIVAPPSITLKLTGQKTDGTTFIGTDTIRIVDVGVKK